MRWKEDFDQSAKVFYISFKVLGRFFGKSEEKGSELHTSNDCRNVFSLFQLELTDFFFGEKRKTYLGII